MGMEPPDESPDGQLVRNVGVKGFHVEAGQGDVVWHGEV